jgi:hypothetical protein
MKETIFPYCEEHPRIEAERAEDHLKAKRPRRDEQISAILTALSCLTATDAFFVSPSRAYITLSCNSNISPLSCA